MAKKGKEQSPFATAMNQGTDGLSDKQMKSALDDAMSRFSKATNLANVSKEKVIQTGTNLMHTGETMGSLFLGSMVEGYWGEEKLRLGGVDLRAPAGLLMQGYGLYQILNGVPAAGQHFLAIGNGVTGSWLANVGVDAGKAMRERRMSKGGTPTPAPQLPAGPGTAPQAPSMRGEPMVYIPPMETAGYGSPFQGPGGFFPMPGHGQAFMPGQGMHPGFQQQPMAQAQAPGAGGYVEQQVGGPVREIMHTPEHAPRPQVMLTPEQRPDTRAAQPNGANGGGGKAEVSGRNLVQVQPLSRVPRPRAPEGAQE